MINNGLIRAVTRIAQPILNAEDKAKNGTIESMNDPVFAHRVPPG